MRNVITREDSNSMRGLAIVFIVLHNLIHHLSKVAENEFTFSIAKYDAFIDSMYFVKDSLWMDTFSFMGWYGVVTFLFLSGYGLVQKYERSLTEFSVTFWSFMKQHISKLFKLMIIPYLFYIFIEYIVFNQEVTIASVLKQLTFVSNLWPTEIAPGVYWFFGLMLQLYVCYYLFFYKKSNINILILNVLSLVILFSCLYVDKNWKIIYFIRHQFIGWILPFTLGILFARCNFKFDITFKRYWKNLVVFILGVVLLILSNANSYVWVFSPIIAIVVAIYLNELIKRFKYTNKVFIYLGGISASIFVIHPVVRHLYWHFANAHEVTQISIYLIVSIVLSVVYSWMHNYLFNKR